MIFRRHKVSFRMTDLQRDKYNLLQSRIGHVGWSAMIIDALELLYDKYPPAPPKPALDNSQPKVKRSKKR